MLGGVCGGIAKRLGVDTKTVRIVAVISGLFMALGLVVYMTLWLSLIRQGEKASIVSRAGSKRHEKEIVFVVAIAAISLLIATQSSGVHTLTVTAWSVMVSALAALLVWRESSPAEQTFLRQVGQTAPVIGAAPGEGWRWFALRTGASVALLIAGISVLSNVGERPGAAVGVLIGAGALIIGIFVLFAPWWVRIVRDLSKERFARIRAQERADMAAHVHDSVLQTLSLIQRAIDNPTEITRLVRIQERDLRNWLVDPESFGRAAITPSTLAEAAFEIEREIEDTYGVGVEVVVVGESKLDETVLAVLAAGREATVNAAKWSGAQNISIYLEVEPTCISMFVRDLGKGFCQSRVPKDRKGISGSIVDRMTRYGGSATIRSNPGTGTEVELLLPLRPSKL